MAVLTSTPEPNQPQPACMVPHLLQAPGVAADGASERVTGSPLPGSATRTDRGLPGYRAILFERAAANHPAGLPSSRQIPSGNAAFRTEHSLSTGTYRISGLTQTAHSLA